MHDVISYVCQVLVRVLQYLASSILLLNYRVLRLLDFYFYIRELVQLIALNTPRAPPLPKLSLPQKTLYLS